MKFPHLISTCLPQRWVVSFECFLCLVVSYMMRFCLSFTITEMTSVHGAKEDPKSCPYTEVVENGTQKKMEFEWSAFQQGVIHSGLFWGYISTQILGGVLSDIFNHKAVFLWGLLVTCLGTAITPMATRAFNWIGLIICRIIVGMAQGIFYNSLHAITAHWIPLQERGVLGTLVFAGVQFGSAISTFLTSEMLLHFDWSVVFYAYATFGIILIIIFIFTTYSYPSDVPNMSAKEKEIFEEYKKHVSSLKENKKVPVKAILNNYHVWAIFCAMVGQDWGFYTVVTFVPTYLKSVLHLDTRTNGLVNCIGFITLWTIGMFSGLVADYIQKKRWISLTWNRRIIYLISTVIHSAGFIGVSYAECNLTLAIGCLLCGMFALGLFYPSVKVNPMDLSPNFAGTIGSIGQMGGCTSGVLLTYVIGYLTPNSFKSEWRVVFWISYAVVMAGGLLFFFLASAEVQPFNDYEEEGDKSKATT